MSQFVHNDSRARALRCTKINRSTVIKPVLRRQDSGLVVEELVAKVHPLLLVAHMGNEAVFTHIRGVIALDIEGVTRSSAVEHAGNLFEDVSNLHGEAVLVSKTFGVEGVVVWADFQVRHCKVDEILGMANL